MNSFDTNKNIGAIVITGNEKAFAAGADVNDLLNNSYCEYVNESFITHYDRISYISKPIIAAVNGYAVRVIVYTSNVEILNDSFIVRGWMCVGNDV